MSNLMVASTNQIETATLKNGTGGGAPAREEVTLNPMEAAQTRDRHTLWATSSGPPSPLNVDFSFSSNRSLEVLAALNIIAAPGALIGLAMSVQTGTYTPGGSWTSVATISLTAGPLDGFTTFAAVTARSVRLIFTGTGPFAIGRLWTGDLVDLGSSPSPDYVERPERASSRIAGPLGQLFGVDYGRSRTDANFPLTLASPALVASMRSLADRAESFLFLNHRGLGMEARILPGNLTIRERFKDLYDLDVTMSQMV